MDKEATLFTHAHLYNEARAAITAYLNTYMNANDVEESVDDVLDLMDGHTSRLERMDK